MKNKKDLVLKIITLLFGITGLVLIIICITSEEKNNTLLGIALACGVIGNFMNLYQSRKAKK